MCAFIVKDKFGSNVDFLGRVKTIGELQQVALGVAYLCKGCNIQYNTRPKACTNKECGGSDFKKIADRDNLQDQRFISVAIVRDQNDVSSEEETVICDLRDGLAADIDFTFNDVLKLGGQVASAETTEKKIIKDFETFFLYVQVDKIEKVSETLVKKTVEVTEQDRAEIVEYVQKNRATIKDELVASFCARIYGLTDIKEFAVKQIIGARIKDTGIRCDIHGLIIGPPGTGKSEILEESALVGQGVYQSAENLTEAGIVAGLVRDEKTGIHNHEAGIALLTKNVHCLDEIDKNKVPGIFDQLLTVLAKGFYTLRKIRKKDFDTPGPWLLGANPKNMRYNYYETVKNNVKNLHEAILGRMDAIFITNDDYKEDEVNAILKVQRDKARGAIATPIDRERLMKMLVVMRDWQEVYFSDEAFDILDAYYKELKKKSYGAGHGLTITPRQYEGLERLAAANAKMLLKDAVDAEDAKEAIRNYEAWYATIMIDPATGKTDLGAGDGKTSTEISLEKHVLAAITEETQSDRMFKGAFVVQKVKERGDYTDEQIQAQLDALAKEGFIAKMPNGHYLRAK